MLPQRWDEIKEKLDAVLALEPAQRFAYLGEIAGTDPEMYRELESLIASHEKASVAFLSPPLLEALPDQPARSPRDAMIGRRLGTYEVVAQIGAGGMGEVYRAFRADDQYRKQVAIKLVRAGQDSEFVIRRFKNERQILASLDHANIARLLDGGTTEEGVPYFVMELIEGQPIDQYCDDHKLPTAERLKLFSQVCSAVHYAHQHLIIHRDIKPSNILVTDEGVPKLLDFGIAKILDAGAIDADFERTTTLFRILTPGYASPEQVKGEPITTASDVYSLGVVLYELLTGRSPYRLTGRAPSEISRAVCEIEPGKPSTAVLREEPAESGQEPITAAALSSVRDGSPDKLSKRLSGDLDNIVLMALRKEPQRRYASVEQFAEDIRRHLENLPVVARKDTAGYRTSKFVTRHKTGVVAAVAVTLALLVGLAVTLREARIAGQQAQIARQQAEIAREQRARAEQRFNDVRKLANSLMFEVHDSIKDLPGATPARKLLVTRALEYLDSLSHEANGDPSLQRELADAYDKVGDVLGYTGAANLGDFAAASQSYAKALAIRESVAAGNPADLNVQTELAGEYFRVTIVLENTGDFPGALRTLQRAQPFMQRIASGHSDVKLQYPLAGLYYYIANVLEKTGDFSGALRNYRQAASTIEPIADDPQANVFFRANFIADYIGVAKMLAQTGQVDQAVAMSAKSLGMIKQLSEANPTNATLREYVGEAYDTSAEVLEQKGDLSGALELNRRGLEIMKELASADPSNRMATANVGFGDLSLGEILLRQGKIAQAMPPIREAVATFHGAGVSKDLWDATGLSMSYSELGLAYVARAESAVSPLEKMGYWRVARSWYEQALDIWREKPNPTIALDAFGHDQVSQINQQLAKCDANLRKLKD